MKLWQNWQNGARMQRWMKGRLPRSNDITLTQRRIFIFLTGEGALFAVLLLIIFIAGINYANNLILSFCFFLASLLVVSIHHTYAQLSGLRIHIISAADSEAGGCSQYQLALSSTGSALHHEIVLTLETEPEKIVQRMTSVGQTPCKVSLALPTPRRGVFLVQRIVLESRYPLGLLRAWTYIYPDLSVWVAPAPLENRLNGTEQTSPDQETSNSHILGLDEFALLRPHIEGESLARVSWAHAARGQGWLTKQFSQPQGQQLILDYYAMASSQHETKLSQMAYWVLQFTEQNTAFSMRLPDRVLPQGAGLAHKQLALRALAEQP